MKIPCRGIYKLAIGMAGIAIVVSDLCAHTEDYSLADYKSIYSVSGTIRFSGSPQMEHLLELYQSGFAKVQPSVKFENNLDNTLTAVSGVSADGADVGLLGRELWPDEAQAFAAIKGHSPLMIRIATGSYDVPKATFALMVFVPRSNAISSLSLDQLERIFGAAHDPIRVWGELGLRGAWVDRPIHLYGFARNNDKAVIFRQLVFRRHEPWSAALREFVNAAGPHGLDAGELILRAVASDPGAVGISNIHYATDAVRAVPLSLTAGSRPVPPTLASVAAGVYPLTRAIYIVVDPEILVTPKAQFPTGPAVVEFLRYVLSRQGAQAVKEEGDYLPLTAAMAHRELSSLLAAVH